jgi:hypothetical protein
MPGQEACAAPGGDGSSERSESDSAPNLKFSSVSLLSLVLRTICLHVRSCSLDFSGEW